MISLYRWHPTTLTSFILALKPDDADTSVTPNITAVAAVSDEVTASSTDADPTYQFDHRHVGTEYGTTSITVTADGAEGTSFVIAVAAP